MEPEKHYREAVSHALAGFQLIEESLKDYIGCYHDTIRLLLPDSIAYFHDRSDIQDAALGKLVNVFSKINSNTDLIGKLRKLTKTRDHLAHKAFVHLYQETPPLPELASRAEPLLRVAEQIAELLTKLRTESIAVVRARPKQPK